MSQRVSPFPVPPPDRRPSGRRSFRFSSGRTAFVGLLALGSATGLWTAVAVAGDSPDGPVGPPMSGATAPGATQPGATAPAAPVPGTPPSAAPLSSAQSPRAASVEAEVRALERVLGGLRRVRTELRAGRPEPMAADDAARQAQGLDLRALREVLRYEALRSKTLAALAKASEAKDDGKASEARAALETLDGTFAAALARIEAGAKPQPKPAAGSPEAKEPRTGKGMTPSTAEPKPGAGAGEAAKPGDAPSAPKKRVRAPGAAGSGGAGPGQEKPAAGGSGDGSSDGNMGFLDDDEDDPLDDDLGE